MEGETAEHVRLVSNSISNDDRGKVETILGGLPGVNAFRVDGASHAVEVEFDPRVVDLNAIKEALQAGGFPVQNEAFAAPRDEPQ